MTDQATPTHLLHLVRMDEGNFTMMIECVFGPAVCEHGTGEGTHPDGPETPFCSFADWHEDVGNEMLLDRDTWQGQGGVPRFPTDPSFPIPVKPYGWDDDGPLVVFDDCGGVR